MAADRDAFGLSRVHIYNGKYVIMEQGSDFAEISVPRNDNVGDDNVPPRGNTTGAARSTYTDTSWPSLTITS